MILRDFVERKAPEKEDGNRGFAWGKRYVDQRSTPPLSENGLNHYFR
jgi:hypothetical protein